MLVFFFFCPRAVSHTAYLRCDARRGRRPPFNAKWGFWVTGEVADNDETKMIPTVSRFISRTRGRFMCKWLVRKNKRHKGLGVNQGEALLDNEIFFFWEGEKRTMDRKEEKANLMKGMEEGRGWQN